MLPQQWFIIEMTVLPLVVAIATPFVWSYSGMTITLAAIGLFIVGYIFGLVFHHSKLLYLLIILIIASCFSPIDISYKTAGNPPRIVRIVYGEPTDESINKARMGEIVLRSENVKGRKPQWCVIW